MFVTCAWHTVALSSVRKTCLNQKGTTVKDHIPFVNLYLQLWMQDQEPCPSSMNSRRIYSCQEIMVVP